MARGTPRPSIGSSTPIDGRRKGKRSVQLGTFSDPGLGRTHYRDWADRWFGLLIDLRPKTLVGYDSLLRTHVLPEFGDTELRRITRLRVREWVAGLEQSGLSPSRIRQAHQVLHASLKAAIDGGYLTINPAAGTRLPRTPRRETRFLDATELGRLVDVAGDRWGALIMVLGYGGLRWGEAAALRVGRCDLLHKRLEVAESLTDISGLLEFGPTKNHQVRAVAINASLRDRLAGEIAGRGQQELVFTAPRGGPLRHGNFSRRVWPQLRRDAGLPDTVRIHDLRHTAASLLVAAGVHAKVVQQQLGHSSIVVTMDRYGHLYPDTLDDVAERLEAAYQRGRGPILAPQAVTELPKRVET